MMSYHLISVEWEFDQQLQYEIRLEKDSFKNLKKIIEHGESTKMSPK